MDCMCVCSNQVSRTEQVHAAEVNPHNSAGTSATPDVIRCCRESVCEPEPMPRVSFVRLFQ